MFMESWDGHFEGRGLTPLLATIQTSILQQNFPPGSTNCILAWGLPQAAGDQPSMGVCKGTGQEGREGNR